MTERYFIGDIHAGHDNILKWRNQFRDEQDMYESVKDNYHSVVTKRDVVVFMGDIAMTKKRLQDIKQWTAFKKVMILGNHDLERDGIKVHDLFDVFDEIHGVEKKNGFWLTHVPLHPSELRGKPNIHGHTHGTNINDFRYFNASCENINFTPISIQDIRKRMASDKENYIKSIKGSNLKSFKYSNGFRAESKVFRSDELIKALSALDYQDNVDILYHNDSGIGSNIIVYDTNKNPIADITNYNEW